MSTATLQPERGDDRNARIEIERLHEMTNQDFVELGFISDLPGTGIGEIIPIKRRSPNSLNAVGSIAFKRTFMKPGLMPKIAAQSPEYNPHQTGRDPEILPRPTTVPPETYIG